ncbi:MAG TPA: hypothetical protein VIX82_09745 [Solirubrobacteraceae bacterium]
MTLVRRGAIAAMVVGSMAGGAVGATVLTAASSSAATTTTTHSGSAPTPGAYGAGPQSGGVFHSNENGTHEKSESGQREAQETAGQFPTVP